MQYMLLIYGDMSAFPEMTHDERNANMKDWDDYSTWLTEKGWMKGGDALEDIDQATSVRIDNGERVVTDGQLRLVPGARIEARPPKAT